jgi:SAM-dependent methyltransferase
MLPAGAHLTLLDASSAMLERGRRRLGPFGTSERVALRVGDLCQLPFEVGAVQRIFHFGVLHCLDQPSRALSEFRRALHPLGELWLSSLVLGRPLGDRLLGRLHEGRHIGVPKSAQEVLDLVQSEGFRVERHWTRGSLLFLRAAHRH